MFIDDENSDWCVYPYILPSQPMQKPIKIMVRFIRMESNLYSLHRLYLYRWNQSISEQDFDENRSLLMPTFPVISSLFNLSTWKSHSNNILLDYILVPHNYPRNQSDRTLSRGTRNFYGMLLWVNDFPCDRYWYSSIAHLKTIKWSNGLKSCLEWSIVHLSVVIKPFEFLMKIIGEYSKRSFVEIIHQSCKKSLWLDWSILQREKK